MLFGLVMLTMALPADVLLSLCTPSSTISAGSDPTSLSACPGERVCHLPCSQFILEHTHSLISPHTSTHSVRAQFTPISNTLNKGA